MKPAWLIELSKKLDGQLSEVTSGLVVKLAAGDAPGKGEPLRRRAILCRTGSWEGMFGPVEITKEKLEAIAARYNRERENPINENDYAPILVDHERKADLIKGRVDISGAQLSVEVISGSEESAIYGLFADLRVDDEDAISKVLKGVYAQISISFNEETFELYEVSFVAVEAARRSIVLNKGDGNVDIKTLTQQVANLQQRMTDGASARKALCQNMGASIQSANTLLEEVKGKVQDSVLSLKTSALSATFKGFVKQGKMSKAEFDKVDLKALSSMDPNSLKVVLGSYESRPVTANLGQVGRSGQQPIDDKALKTLSKSSMKEAMDAQRKGVNLKAPNLEDGEEDESALENGDEDNGGDEATPADAPSFKEVEKVIEDLNALEGQVSKFGELYKSLKETLEKLSKLDEQKQE